LLGLVQKVGTQKLLGSPEQGPVSVREARSVGLSNVRGLTDTEVANLADATGRVLAQSIIAVSPLPRFDHSAIDGYAIDAEGIRPDTTLNVVGRIVAGRIKDDVGLKRNSAIRIMTGARIPPGVNAVVAQEEVRREGNCIALLRTPAPGENIRMCGEDARTGDVLVSAGTCMGPLEAGVAASAGCGSVRIFRKIRVAIFTAGSELRQPGERVSPGEIYDSNRFILKALLDKPWIDIIDLGAAPDKPQALLELLQKAASQADVIVTAGGVSVGDEDHMVEAVHRCGGHIFVNKVAIKPGKPLVLGRVGDVSYVGLPGNPGAVFTTFLVIVDDLLRARAGMKPRTSLERPAIAGFE
jgi:molybdopterin molybdotransferase